MATYFYSYKPLPNANTPDPPDPISLEEIYKVFGPGLDDNKGYDLFDYRGLQYWETFFPFRKDKFSSNTESEISIEDFYSKTSSDPVSPGWYLDFDVTADKSIKCPPFRRKIKFEIWGAGGGGGAGDHDATPATAARGANSSITYTLTTGTTLTANAGGGGGGTGGYRYGDQNGSGGGGGIGTTVVGQSGSNGNAGGGKGGNGGSANTGSLAFNPAYAGYGAGGVGDTNKNGTAGVQPGGGGGGGGSSDFQSGKNANPNRAAGGGGGSGGYSKIILTRSQLAPQSPISYKIGAGGLGATGNLGNGGRGAAGGIRVSWDYDPADTTTTDILISQWKYPFEEWENVGWNDLYLTVGTSKFTRGSLASGIITTGNDGGIILWLTGAKCGTSILGGFQTSGHKAYGNPAGSIAAAKLMLDGNPLYVNKLNLDRRLSYKSKNWEDFFKAQKGDDKLSFKIETGFDGTTFFIKVYGNGKGGKGNEGFIKTIYPNIYFPSLYD